MGVAASSPAAARPKPPAASAAAAATPSQRKASAGASAASRRSSSSSSSAAARATRKNGGAAAVSGRSLERQDHAEAPPEATVWRLVNAAGAPVCWRPGHESYADLAKRHALLSMQDRFMKGNIVRIIVTVPGVGAWKRAVRVPGTITLAKLLRETDVTLLQVAAALRHHAGAPRVTEADADQTLRRMGVQVCDLLISRVGANRLYVHLRKAGVASAAR